MPQVVRLSIAPVKSTRVQHPETVHLERYGAVGNRTFHLTDEDGRLLTDSAYGALLQLVSEYDQESEWLRIWFPDGALVEGDATAMGRPVTTSFYGRSASGRTLRGPWEHALSAFAGRRVELVRTDEPGAANDDTAVSMLSVASARELGRRQGGSVPALDSRRFRMLVEFDGVGAHEEDTWLGRRVGLGEAVVQVVRRVARCVVTTLDPDSGAKDFDTLKAIASYRPLMKGEGIPFGVYADVLEPGTIRVGDRVVPGSA